MSMDNTLRRSIALWAISFIITVVAGVYQRVTGPSYPAHGRVALGGAEGPYTLARSHGGPTDHTVTIIAPDSAIHGTLEWRRHSSTDAWIATPMQRRDGSLAADLPHQPPAGKIQYRVRLASGNQEVVVPAEGSIVIRFKGDVPLLILILHITAMFSGMLLSTRTGLECFSTTPRYRSLAYSTIGFLLIGGAVLGPFVQWYAFNAFWTGWPAGTDLTDNKTAIALLSWILAAIAVNRSQIPKRWILAAAIITLAVYAIPHSMMGSELDYSSKAQGAAGSQR